MKEKYYINWSGGKDSSLCLYKAKERGMDAEALLTSVNKTYDRISMHGVRRSLLEQQALSLQLPLNTLELPEEPGMPEYEKEMDRALAALKKDGFSHALFGDIFLEDLRRYREEKLAKAGMVPAFPLWKINTRELLEEFIALGFKAIIVCVNASFLDKRFCGRLIDASFLADLPLNADPCGENGEYHSFVFDGPIFTHPVDFSIGEIVYKEYRSPAPTNGSNVVQDQPDMGFYFCDLLPTSSAFSY